MSASVMRFWLVPARVSAASILITSSPPPTPAPDEDEDAAPGTGPAAVLLFLLIIITIQLPCQATLSALQFPERRCLAPKLESLFANISKTRKNLSCDPHCSTSHERHFSSRPPPSCDSEFSSFEHWSSFAEEFGGHVD